MILTIGFDGVSRVGKGTQLALLSDRLTELTIPHLTVKGDGARLSTGNPGDPLSEWWIEKRERLCQGSLEDYPLWNEASYRLAHELVVWRREIMPQMAGDSHGVLLCDRSIFSRAMTVKEQGLLLTAGNLYPPEQGVTLAEVCPDLIFLLIAPKDVLLERLGQDDGGAKNFKRTLIERKCEWYPQVLKELPWWVQARTLLVNAVGSKREIANQIWTAIVEHYPELEVRNDRLEHALSEPGLSLAESLRWYR